ncbi:tRNA threonylcarbamoyladenosine biosynthesis protein TsaB [Salirhabdus euzebyi]|uniref:tRNA threonylcarbamoyladenosine biosynthesis protein TsaB n=1 Tax=Salirhabdus euzebyi TaxID=394506 RepID=A0A841Q8D3_9BACI|nr:tRNA (adenosine(37)-N6)-threonylcarbamoyltransferase complex dimerization subunit type 1 TsaB [Salirhabdus euzebyi]MBB6454859.1 tRNA threonylcarbamoyladenosine biosynthesis protein TsaB [Salirhabdus euzebyi]
MKVLAMDTSNQVMSVAILNDNQVIGEYTTNVKQNHSVRLMPAIDRVMKDAGIQPNEIEKMAVAVGPGSFTGVRIGVTTAKTMAWSLNIPLVGVSSLELVAYNCILFNGKICSFFDARRGQVYAGLYESNGDHLKVIGEEKNILFEDMLKDLANLNEKVLFVSNDLSLHKETIDQILGDKAVFASNYLSLPKAAVLGLLASNREAAPIHNFVPNYMRLAEAEANWLANNQGKNKNG